MGQISLMTAATTSNYKENYRFLLNDDIRLPARYVVFLWQFLLVSENFSFLVLLAYTVHWRLCEYVLYKSTIDIDIDTTGIISVPQW